MLRCLLSFNTFPLLPHCSQIRGALPSEVTSGQWADLAVFCWGLVSGLGASVVTQPADVIKTRVQLTSTLATGGASVSLTNAIGLIYQVWWGREGRGVSSM